MRLNAFLSLGGYFEGAWRREGASRRPNTDLDGFVDLALQAEAGGFDSVFIADSLSLWGDVRRGPTGTFEPSVLAAALLARTRSIGAIITLSTTYNEPFNVARRLASLDWASDGRIGWNIVTTASEQAARNFGGEALPDHAERYERCREFVDVCVALWKSWDDDAIVADPTGPWASPDAVRAIRHRGRHFSVDGPLDIPRSPQVVPLLVQAGTSPEGRDVAARFADAVFVVDDDLDRSCRNRAQLQEAARALGRRHLPAVLPGIVPVIGTTRADAEERLRDLVGGVDVELGARAIETRFGLPPGSLDPGDPFDLDLGLPAVSEENGNQTLHRVLRSLAEHGERTVADAVRWMNTARGHLLAVGTADDVAACMVRWFDEGGADGFNVIFPVLPEDLRRFTELVVPRLVERGVVAPPDAHVGSSLRERYGTGDRADLVR